MFILAFVSCYLDFGAVPAVSPSTKNFFSDFDDIWYVDHSVFLDAVM